MNKNKQNRLPGGFLLEIIMLAVLVVGVVYLVYWSQWFYTRISSDAKFAGGRWTVFPLFAIMAFCLDAYFDRRHARLLELGCPHSLSNPNGKEVFYAFALIGSIALIFWL